MIPIPLGPKWSPAASHAAAAVRRAMDVQCAVPGPTLTEPAAPGPLWKPRVASSAWRLRGALLAAAAAQARRGRWFDSCGTGSHDIRRARGIRGSISSASGTGNRTMPLWQHLRLTATGWDPDDGPALPVGLPLMAKAISYG